MRLYLIRHGETEWNRDGKLQGRIDIPLDETGRKQAELLRDELSGIDFDVCIASPLKRARETAEIIMDGKCKIVFDERIIERDFGEFEGMLVKDWEDSAGDVDTWDIKLNWGERGYEPARQVLVRAKEFLADVRGKYPPSYCVAVVAHGSLLKALHYTIVGYTDETNFHEVYFRNTEVRKYDI